MTGKEKRRMKQNKERSEIEIWTERKKEGNKQNKDLNKEKKDYEKNTEIIPHKTPSLQS
jgi:hypothetical protein